MTLRDSKTKLLNWFKWAAKYFLDLFGWFWKPWWPVKAALIVAVLTDAVVYVLAPCVERQIRLSGMLLELLGVFTVMVGLRGKGYAFDNLPTMLGGIKQWWMGRPRFGPQHRIISGVGTSSSSAVGNARARTGPGPDTPLDRRVAMLEQQYGALFDEVGVLDAQVKKTTEEPSKALETERREREHGDETNREQLKKAVAEGLILEVFGTIFFLLGIVGATASSEIALLLGASSSCP